MKSRDKWFWMHMVALFLGSVAAAPLSFLPIWVRADQERFDVWSGFHALATVLWATLFHGWFSVPWAAVAAWGVMYGYEVLVDGLRLEDPRGASRSDLGWNTIGAVLWMLAILIGRLLR